MMRDAIRQFNTQFEFNPEVVNKDKLGRHDSFIVAGMGGSNLVMDLLQLRDPSVRALVHRDYGLPVLSEEELRRHLIIVSSYSGNTEEAMSSFEEARKRKFPFAAIASGGKLIESVERSGAPHIVVPQTGIQPRSALGFNVRAVLKLMQRDDLFAETAALASSLNPADHEPAGKELAKKMKGRVPIIYSSTKNRGIAYNWKIKFNETGKIPAFYNVFPELNHNEMTGFDPVGSYAAPGRTAADREKINGFFYCIFLKDPDDHPQVRERMEILEKLYQDRGVPVAVLELSGANVWQKVFSSLLYADWTAYYSAEQYGLEPEQVPMVEEFKKSL